MSSALQEKEILFKSIDARPDRIASRKVLMPDQIALHRVILMIFWCQMVVKRNGVIHL